MAYGGGEVGLIAGGKSLTAEGSEALQGPGMGAGGRNGPAGGGGYRHMPQSGQEATVHPIRTEDAGFPHTAGAHLCTGSIYPVSRSITWCVCGGGP